MKSEGHWLPKDTGRSHLSQDRRGASLPKLGSCHLLLSISSRCCISDFFQCQKQKVWHYPQPPRALSSSFGPASTPLTSICVTENIILHGDGSSKQAWPESTDLAKHVEKVAGSRSDVSQRPFQMGGINQALQRKQAGH